MDVSEPLILSVSDQEDESLISTINPQTMHQLLTGGKSPHDVVEFVRDAGLFKLGDFTINDASSLSVFDDEEFIVRGLDKCTIDYETFWRETLHQAKEDEPVEEATHRHAGHLSVTLDAYVVTVRDAAFPDDEGLIHNLLTMHQHNTISAKVFSIPAVQAVVNYKWSAFALRMLLVEFAFYLAWLISFTTFTFLFQSEDEQLPLADLLKTPNGPLTVGAMACSLVFMTPFILIELATITNYQGGWVNAYNIIDITLYAIQITSAVLYFRREHLNSQLVALAMAVQHVLMWFRIQYFSRVFKATKFSFVDSVKHVMVEIRWYIFFMALLWWGFACAFHVLFREDQHYSGFSNLPNSLVTIFIFSMSGSLPGAMVSRGSGWCALGLAMVFQFLMSMILMKLLIGIMSSSITKVNKEADTMWMLGKAEVIDELESSIPSVFRSYMKSCYPRYIHILRINKSSVSAAEMKILWPETVKEAAVEVKQAPKPITNAELAAQMASLQKQLSQLAAQLEAQSGGASSST